jgi:hypothetical protein
MHNLQAIIYRKALTLLSNSSLASAANLAVSKAKGTALHMPIRCLAFHERKHLLIHNIKVTLRAMRIHFKQKNLDTYLEKLFP